MKQVGALILGSLAFWAVIVVPARALVGVDAIVQSLAALALALVPAVATLAWATWAYRNSPEMQLLAVLGGSAVRMAVALGGAWVLVRTYPFVFDETLWILLVLCYLWVLGLEVTLLVL